MGEVINIEKLVIEDEALVSRKIFVDSEIYALELERIFAKCWLYLGHESELPNPGDYVTRYMGEDSLIVARGHDGRVRAFLNSCMHRGTQICRADSGNARHFICPYHAWTYDTTGKLFAIPRREELYQGRLDFSKLSLPPVAQIDTYAGLIFGTWDAEAPSLEEYLGDAKWYLEMIFKRTPGGMEVLGPPQKWVVETNWKIGPINFSGDGQHIPHTHRGVVNLGLIGPPTAIHKQLMEGYQICMGNGHNGNIFLAPPGGPGYIGFPEELHPLFESTLSKQQSDLLHQLLDCVGTVFPNMSWNLPAADVEHKMPVVFTNLRVWYPKGPNKIEIWNWYFADKEASQEWKEASLQTGLRSFGISGTFEQDDMEVWTSIVQATRGLMARRYYSNFRMCLPYLNEPVMGLPWPGDVYATNYTECSEFAFLRRWKELMLVA